MPAAGSDEGKADKRRAGASPPDPAADGVRSAYRVIDDYVRRGTAAARTLWSPGGRGGEDPGAISDRFIRYATDLSSTWVDMMSAMMNGSGPPPATGVPPGPFHATTAPEPTPSEPGSGRGAAGRPVSIAIELKARRPCRVTVSLDDGWSGGDLRVAPLAPVVGAGPALRGVTLERDGTDRGLVVRLPANARVGRYEGAILQGDSQGDDGTAVGRLAIELRP